MYQVSLSEKQVIGRNVSLQVLLPEAVCCCLLFSNVALTLEWYCVPVYQVSQASLNILTPEARLQTRKCGFDIRVELCTSVPSLKSGMLVIGINISLQVFNA